MGIPRFFKWLIDKYPDLIWKTLGLNEDTEYVEGLYIDLNTPIHNVCQRVFKYNLSRDLMQDDFELQTYYRQMPVQDREKILFKNLGYYLLYAFLTVKPKKVFMISVDGVAPKAKMVQQRFRRFRPSGAPLDFFDPVVISPGTKFMDDLDRYLSVEWPLTYKDQISKISPNIDIVYSSHREPGEGEHKIFEQMNYKIDNKDMTRLIHAADDRRKTPYNVVLGADADLIVLSLTQSSNIIFMRDNMSNDRSMDLLERAIQAVLRPPCDMNSTQYAAHCNKLWQDCFNGGFTYSRMTEIRNKLITDYMNPGGSRGTNEIADFSIVTFFLGNDFLPAMPELEILTLMAPMTFTYEDIQERYPDIFRYGGKPGMNAQGKPYKHGGRGTNLDTEDPVQTFNPRDLGKERIGEFSAKQRKTTFDEKEKTWTREDGSVNYGSKEFPNDSIFNKEEEQYEMYPTQKDPITGIIRRVLYTKKKGEKRWNLQMEDIGALPRALEIYKKLTQRIRNGSRGRGNSYIVERKDRINYVNLLEYLREISGFAPVFMKTLAVQHDFLKNNPTKDRAKPDDLIRLSLGVESSGKKRTPALVSATFFELHRARAFGIFDSKYADPKLSKQSIDEMCRKWLEGAQWVLKYYNDGLRAINTQWFYPYQYSPSVPDLIRYIEERIAIEVPGYPGIRQPKFEDSVEVNRINIEGMVVDVMRQNPMNPQESMKERITNRAITGVIHTYIDREGTLVSLMRLTSGEQKFIDLDELNFIKPVKTIIQRGGITNFQSALEELDPNKINLIETRRDSISIPVVKTFVLEDEIYGIIADDKQPYASVIESFFSIMPERVLKLILSPWLVDFVVGQLTDCFPASFELMKHGKFYENASVPRIPMVSPTRLQRVIDGIPQEFDIEIARYNVVEPRQLLLHKGSLGIKSRAIRIATNQGSGAANIATHTRKIQDLEVPVTELTKYVTGGLGDPLGGLLPQFSEYYASLFGTKEVVKQLYTDAELFEMNRLKQYKLVFNSFTQGGLLTMPLDLPINYNLLPANIPFRERPEIKERDGIDYLGQRKLLINEIIFLTKYGHLAKLVVYVGAAPGIHIPIVAKLFPDHKFDLWDPEGFTIPANLTTEKNKKANIEIFKKPFTYDDALSYRGKDTLLISDLRNLSHGSKSAKPVDETSSDGIQSFDNRATIGLMTNKTRVQETSKSVIYDNIFQFGCFNIMRPKMGSMKFRLAFNYDVKQVCPVGDIWLQPWAYATSAEVRLILSGTNAVQIPISALIATLGLKDESQRNIFTSKLANIVGGMEKLVESQVIAEYSLVEFENKMYYFNTILNNARNPMSYGNSLGITDKEIPTFQPNFRCTYEVYAWDQYFLLKFPNTAREEDGIRKRREGTVIIMDEVSRCLGKDLQLADISGGRSAINRRSFSVPWASNE